VYPGLKVEEIDQHGHALDHPDLGAIYKEGNWWGWPMISFGRADVDGAMP
jgi:glucose/arabinose dehydrogenase